MALTLESVSAELATADSMDEVCHAISRGSLMGARGNSGVITSQILRGCVDVFRRSDEVTAPDVRDGAAPRRRRRVPSGACVRSRARSSPSCARRPKRWRRANGADLVGVARRGRHAARCRGRTHARAAAGARATRVSSTRAARASRLLLDALLEVVDGRPIPEPEIVATPAVVEAHLAGDDVSGLRYEVMYLLDADRRHDARLPRTRGARSATRSSSSAATACGTATSTPTTSAPRSKPGIEAGRPRNIRVTDLFEQVEGRDGGSREAGVAADAREAAASRPPSSRSGSATVCAGCSRASACSRWSRAASR